MSTESSKTPIVVVPAVHKDGAVHRAVDSMQVTVDSAVDRAQASVDEAADKARDRITETRDRAATAAADSRHTAKNEAVRVIDATQEQIDSVLSRAKESLK
jgi:F0F1-type ATP synthase membrane subunit b/b'